MSSPRSHLPLLTLLAATVFACSPVRPVIPTYAPIPTATPLPPATPADQWLCSPCIESSPDTKPIGPSNLQKPFGLEWLPEASALAFVNGGPFGPFSIELLDPTTWAVTQQITSTEKGASNFDISPDGTRFLLGHQVIDRATAQVLFTIPYDYTPLQFSPDSAWVVGDQYNVMDQTGHFYVWDASTGVLHITLSFSAPYRQLYVLHPTNGTLGIYTDKDGWLGWNLSTGKLIGLYDPRFNQQDPSFGLPVRFSPPYSSHGQWLIVSDWTNPGPSSWVIRTKLVDVNTNEQHSILQHSPTFGLGPEQAVWSNDDKTLAIIGYINGGGYANIWDVDTGDLRDSFQFGAIRSAALSPNGNNFIWIAGNTLYSHPIRPH